MKVADKVIIMASVGNSSSNDYLPADGSATNDKAGLKVDGYPVGFNSNALPAYDKTLLWNYGLHGIADLGTSNMDGESFWDMKGGSFRITNQRVIGSNIVNTSYGLRINQNDELELVKKFYYSPSNGYVFKRLMIFGRQLG